MTKLSLKQFSLLSIVLLGASAVAAAFVPNKKPVKVFEACNGLRITDGDGNITCTAGSPADCHRTVAGTTGTGTGDANTTANPANTCS